MPPILKESQDSPDTLEISLSGLRGASFGEALAKIKEIPGRRWNGKAKVWEIPREPAVAERAILSLQPTVSDELRSWVDAERLTEEQELVTRLPEDATGLNIAWANQPAPWQPDEINGEPFKGLHPHQRALVAALADLSEVRAIVADDMGLGKTIQTISTVAEIATRDNVTVTELGPKLIVCPNSVKGVWRREIHRWLGADEEVFVAEGTAKAREASIKDAISSSGWLVVNYEQLRVQKVKRRMKNGGSKTVTEMKQPLFSSTKWAAVIADEAHRAKNRKAAQTKGLFKTRGRIMIAATGTPLMNSPDELWALLHWLFPETYTSFWRFFENYVDYVDGYMGKVINGVKNPDGLRFELRNRMFRRTKAQVLDLPEKQRIVVPIEIGDKQRKMYRQAETQLWLEVEQAVKDGDKTAAEFADAVQTGSKSIYSLPNGAARTVRLRQVLSSPAILGGEDESAKLDSVVESIVDNQHKQHVVFTEFVETTKLIQARLEKHGLAAAIYTGQTTPSMRTAIEDQFQSGTIQVVVGTIPAMKEGITLTASDTVHFVERAWVPGWNEQAEDRLHRIGQRNTVTVYIYQAVETVDDGRVKPTLEKKERIVKAIIPKDQITTKEA